MTCRMWLLIAALASAQPPPTIRVDVNLIQVDATVTGRDGKRVTDLTAADFEVQRDGKRQQIKTVLWVPGQRVNAPPVPASPVPMAVSRELRPEDVRRTIAIMIDDMSLSMSSMHYTREAVKKLIQEKIDPHDLVAIYRTSSGIGLMQQFTTDRRHLLASIDRMKFGSMKAIDPLAPLSSNAQESSGDPAIAQMAIEDRLREDVQNRELQDMRTASMLGAVNLAVRGLRELPGRKAMVLFSESLQLFDAPAAMHDPTMAGVSQRPGAMGGKRNRTEAAARSLIDTANRAGVMISTIDPRGLVVTSVTAADDVANMDSRRMVGLSAKRGMDVNLSQDGMRMLAEETGGVFYRNTNDIAGSLQNALDDQEGYYLIAFQPDDATFEKAKDGAKFQRLSIKVKRSGASIRYRRGFYGVPDPEPSKPAPLGNALLSPFRASGVPVKLTPIFMQTEKSGPFLRTLLHIDASTLEFKEVPADAADKNQEPWQQTTLNEVVVLFDETGRVVDQVGSPQQIKARGVGLESLKRYGLDQHLDVPVPRPGPYQLRSAVLDRTSGRTGSAAQFVEVPDLKRKRLALSGIILSSVAWAEDKDPTGSSAQRVVQKGQELEYAVSVFNSIPAPAGQRPNLLTQLRLYREGTLVYTGKKTPLTAPERLDDGLVLVRGRARVSSPPGEYVLEIAVQDLSAPAKQQAAVRYIDFTIRE
jgi:VWFA-related protein